MTDTIFDIQADFCKVMGNPARLQIIHALREGPMKVGEIAEATGFGQTMVSRQLSALRRADVVEGQRQGTEIIYELTDRDIVEVCDLVRKVLTAQVQKQSRSLHL